MLTDDELLALAGRQAFARGEKYCEEGRIALTRSHSDGLQGEAEGSEIYALRLERRGAGWHWTCACPAAENDAQWPAWRERALGEVASRECGDASHRAALLEHDGDLPGAIARICKLAPDILERLARRLERDAPGFQ